MTEEIIYQCIIGEFGIKDAFDAIDVLFNLGYMSVSCAEKNKRWFVEILNDTPISETSIKAALKHFKYSTLKQKKLENVDWLKKCFENFKPITVGSFYIYGPHLRKNAIPVNKMPIEIAAATAFGTGEHPTTHNCLRACETFFDYRKHKTALDIGCGSCILSIALAKLGARDVTACDNDPEAVRVSLENVVINKVAHRISIFQNEACEFANKTYDFVVANILAEPLISISECVVKSLADNGILVLSGFTSDDNSVLQKYLSLGLTLKYRYDLKDWTTLVFEKKSI
ncbi:MAG: 50S ribosomal protein L11 methyltransferase [Alphaproteobacteria bacterium]|nr:50S ribosomal protein L11 methyltransferase [Alphaproteobacteria bacterium]